jgi:hypothetical protein
MIANKQVNCKVSKEYPFKALVKDLQLDGPVRPDWDNYSKLGGSKHHCHLNYRYVACWTSESKTITIEVYYVGSRENAPY